jgi:hypothetical protein
VPQACRKAASLDRLDRCKRARKGGYRPAHLLVITTAIFVSMQPRPSSAPAGLSRRAYPQVLFPASLAHGMQRRPAKVRGCGIFKRRQAGAPACDFDGHLRPLHPAPPQLLSRRAYPQAGPLPCSARGIFTRYKEACLSPPSPPYPPPLRLPPTRLQAPLTACLPAAAFSLQRWRPECGAGRRRFADVESSEGGRPAHML